MTSYCDVTNSAYPVSMTTIRHCSILEFGSGASNQAVAPGITRLLHATDRKLYCTSVLIIIYRAVASRALIYYFTRSNFINCVNFSRQHITLTFFEIMSLSVSKVFHWSVGAVESTIIPRCFVFWRFSSLDFYIPFVIVKINPKTSKTVNIILHRYIKSILVKRGVNSSEKNSRKSTSK